MYILNFFKNLLTSGNIKVSLIIIVFIFVAKLISYKPLSFFYIMIITTSLIMALFICLGYLMDRMTDDSIRQISTIKKTLLPPLA